MEEIKAYKISTGEIFDDSDLEDRAAIYLEEMNISGDTMVQMNHHLDDMPKDKIGAYYLNDLMAGFVRRNEDINQPLNTKKCQKKNQDK